MRHTVPETFTNKNRYQEIDVLRGLAAFTVVLSHYIPYWDRYVSEIPVLIPNSWGFNAVKLFFVISGFVIFFTLDRCKTLFDFSLSRFARLYPAYITVLVFVYLIGLLFLDKGLWLSGFLANTTMFQEFLGYSHFDNVYWSLSVELAFYLNAALLLVLGAHKKIKTLVLVWLFASILWHTVIFSPEDEARDWFALLFVLDYIPYFAMGMLFFDAKKNNGWNTSGTSLLLLCIATEYLLSSWTGMAIAIGSATLFYLALNYYLRFAINKFTLWLGAISYALYLVHRNLGYAALKALGEAGAGPVFSIILTTIAAVLLASIITFTIERPLASRIKNQANRYRLQAG